jgi:hypothetical protein
MSTIESLTDTLEETKDEIPVVSAALYIQIQVECPHCEEYLDLLQPGDTDEVQHNDEGHLLNQAIPSDGNWTDAHPTFECQNVTCSTCHKPFNVEALEW